MQRAHVWLSFVQISEKNGTMFDELCNFRNNLKNLQLIFKFVYYNCLGNIFNILGKIYMLQIHNTLN